MLLTRVVVMAGVALLIRLVGRGRLRGWLVLAASGLAVFALQPPLPIRYLDFWLPTATLALTLLGWLLTAPPGTRRTRENLLAAALLAGTVLAAGLTRYLGPGTWLVESRPPGAGQVAAGLALLVGLFAGLGWLLRRAPARAAAGLLAAAGVTLIALLVILKTPALALESARVLRGLAGQNPALAAPFDIRWLGFSYIVFRLLHTLRDRQAGRLPPVDLRTYASYVIFFPALLAGPIDRLERFARDFTTWDDGDPVALGIVARPMPLAGDARLAADLTAAAPRLVMGLFKKFVLADTLGLIALSPANALQVREPGWLWLLIYLYAFQIYFDFAGYTDIAIGVGQVLGIRLPENFAAPYRKPNLTQFWNSWHMSLTQWFRAYFFNPLVRALRGGPLPALLVMFGAQLGTMLLIGAWHGVTAGFLIWGLWHGLGLFVQNRWSERSRAWFAARPPSPRAERVLRAAGVLLTFHYVALGWVWFVIPAPETAGRVLLRMVGLAW